MDAITTTRTIQRTSWDQVRQIINKTSKLTIKWKYKDLKVLQGKALDLESNIYGLQALYVSAGNEIQCWRIKSKPQTFRLYPKNFSAEEFISAIHLLYLWDKHRKNCKLCPMSIFTLLVIEAHKVEIKISLFFCPLCSWFCNQFFLSLSSFALEKDNMMHSFDYDFFPAVQR